MVVSNNKINIKPLLLVLTFIFVVFSLSSVNAADDMNNETIIDDTPSQNISFSGAVNQSSNGGISVSNSSSSSLITGNVVDSPAVELSLMSRDESYINDYADVSVEYNDYYVDVNNKDFSFAVNQGFNSAHADSNKHVLDIMTFAKNNQLMINVNILNVSNQEVKLSMVDDLTWNLINFIISSFRSIFN